MPTLIGIPKKDSEFLTWGNNFAALITASPTTYGLAAPDAVIIQNVADAFAAAYATATAPSTRNLVTIAAKDGARSAAFTVYSSYYARIKVNPAVTTSDKNDLGVRYPDDPPSPIPPPATPPILELQQQYHLGGTLRFADSATPDKRAKPAGVLAMILVRTVGVAAGTDPELALLDGVFTKQPISLAFGAGDVGKICTLWSRWTNRKGEEGPWSSPISFVVT